LSPVTLSTWGPTCNKVLTVNVILNGFFIPAIIDTGAELNIVSDRLIGYNQRSTRHSTLLLTAGGQKIPSLGETKTSLEIVGSYVGKWDMAKKTLTLEEGLTIRFSHQAKSTSQQNPRLHPQNKKADPSKATQQAIAGKDRERQASSWSPEPSIHEVPRSIFSFPKDTAWAFTVSTTPCNDGVLLESSEATEG